ncbi:MAG: archaemetzincin [Kiritimatiellia bacterium]
MFLCSVFLACSAMAQAGQDPRVAALTRTMEKLRPLHQALEPPGPNDWLAVHPEPGQTFQQYLASHPVIPGERRRVIYIQPLGEFSAKHVQIVELTAEFLACYFGLPVETRQCLALTAIPPRARRRHPQWGVEQILTTYVLEEVLRPRLPPDAAVYLALTPADLWPGPGWNFVFGQASLRDRVGVWSLYRNGDPEAGEAEFKRCLTRTLKTAAHETGHMFSMLHCTAYACCMNGSNHRAEADRRPLWLCPECMAKVCWATGADPIERYRRLAEFCEKQKFGRELDFYRCAIALLESQ